MVNFGCVSGAACLPASPQSDSYRSLNVLSADATEVCSCGRLPDCNSRPLGSRWGGVGQLHWKMVALVHNYKGVKRPVPALGANSVYSVFREPAVAWAWLAAQ